MQCDLTENNWSAAVRAHLMAGEQENRTDPSILTTTLRSPKEERKGYAGILRAFKAQASFQVHC